MSSAQLTIGNPVLHFHKILQSLGRLMASNQAELIPIWH
jgi:hypothetical protein